MLQKSQTKFSYLDIENEEYMSVMKTLQKQYNYKTIPMIFIDSQFIGGYSELYQSVNEKRINLD